MIRVSTQANRRARWLAFSLIALCASLLTACAAVNPSSSQAPETISIDTFPPMEPGPSVVASPAVRAIAQKFDRGINFGNMLEAPKEGDWGVRAEDRFIDLVDERFTKSVRLPVRWSNHASRDAQAVIDKAFFERVDYIVDRLLARGAVVILNMHHYRQLDGDALDPGEFDVDPAVVEVRFLSMWKQIAERYANRSERLVFELYNEPHGRLETRWNELFSRALRVVRQSNPTRAVVVGPTHYNAAHKLVDLHLPPDPHLILTVHTYEPFAFTHQGAEWVKPTPAMNVTCCDAQQRQLIEQTLDLAAREARRLNYPIFVGEFGAYSKAPETSRIEYSRFMRDAMRSRGLPWFYWELASGFGVFDPASNRFRESLYAALYKD
jgi:endoglucanase